MRSDSLPVDEAEIMDGLNGENTFCHVELGDILGKGIVFDQPKSSANGPS